MKLSERFAKLCADSTPDDWNYDQYGGPGVHYMNVDADDDGVARDYGWTICDTSDSCHAEGDARFIAFTGTHRDVLQAGLILLEETIAANGVGQQIGGLAFLTLRDLLERARGHEYTNAEIDAGGP